MLKKCQTYMDILYDSTEDAAFFLKVWMIAHALLCPRCAAEKHKLAIAKRLMHQSFMPSAPDITNAVMASIHSKRYIKDESFVESYSLRIWTIAGVFILCSLAAAFFGSDFNFIAKSSGFSFLLPIGIVIGGVITAYGAFFVVSNLDKLCQKFGLHADE